MFQEQLKKDFLTMPPTPDKLFQKSIEIFMEKIDRAVSYSVGDRYKMVKIISKKFEMLPLFANEFAIDFKEELIWVEYTEESSTVKKMHRAPKRGFLVETTKHSTFAYFACYFEAMRRWLPGSFAYIIFGPLPKAVEESLYMASVNHLYEQGITYIPTSFEQFKNMKISFFPYPQYSYIVDLFKNDEKLAIDLVREDQPDITMLNISLIKIYNPEKFKLMEAG